MEACRWTWFVYDSIKSLIWPFEFVVFFSVKTFIDAHICVDERHFPLYSISTYWLYHMRTALVGEQTLDPSLEMTERQRERESARTPVSIQWIPCDLNSKYKMNEANRIWKTSRLEFVLWFFFFLSFFNFFWVLAAFDENFIGLSDWNAFLSFNLFAWAQRNPITSESPSIRYISCALGSAFSVFFSSRIQSLESDI